MNWLDGLIIIYLALSTWGGLKRGLVRTVLPLIGLVAGLLLAPRYSPYVAERLPDSLGEWDKVVAFVLIVVVAILAASLLAEMVARLLSLTLLGWADQLGGGALGLALGGLTAAVALALLAKSPFLGVAEDTLRDSALAPYLQGRFSSLLSLLPVGWASVRSFFH